MPSLYYSQPKPIPIPATLYAGSRFSGYQRSGRNQYHVQVEIKHVDMENSFLCGYLKIRGLTDDWPYLCTFFEAEIIGNKYSFFTRKWDATETIDRQHWSRFPSFKIIEYVLDHHDSPALADSDYIYMRWKEQFLVPDHKIKSISGASFAGFYYICFQKSTGDLSGVYFVEYINIASEFGMVSAAHFAAPT